MNDSPRLRLLVVAVGILGVLQVVVSCAGSAQPSDGITPADRALAQQQFENRCANCHGRDGTGNGPMAGSLDPPPRNWTDTGWQDSVDDDWLARVTAGGGQAVGLSSLMPGSQYADNPGFLRAMVEIIRSHR